MGVSKKLSELRSRTSNGKVADSAGLGEMRIQLPDLADFLTPTRGDAGEIPGGTILVFVDSGCIKVCVSDRAVANRFFLVANDWLHVWEVITEAIYDPTTDWRPMQVYSKK